MWITLDYIARRMRQFGYTDFEVSEYSFSLAPQESQTIPALPDTYFYVVACDTYLEVASGEGDVFSPSAISSSQTREHAGKITLKNLSQHAQGIIEFIQVIGK